MDISIIAYLYDGADLIFETAWIGGIVVVWWSSEWRLYSKLHSDVL